MLNNKWKHLECATILKLSVSTSYSRSKQEFSHPDDINLKQLNIVDYSISNIAYIYIEIANCISLSKKVVCSQVPSISIFRNSSLPSARLW